MFFFSLDTGTENPPEHLNDMNDKLWKKQQKIRTFLWLTARMETLCAIHCYKIVHTCMALTKREEKNRWMLFSEKKKEEKRCFHFKWTWHVYVLA